MCTEDQFFTWLINLNNLLKGSRITYCKNHRKCIDISWLDWAYKSSTCDVMYRQQRRHLYYGGQNAVYTLLEMLMGYLSSVEILPM
jgi:hypothetical protein